MTSLIKGSQFSSVCCSVMSDSLPPHESQHTRPPCPSPTPGVHPNPCPSSRWCHPTISSYIVPFSSSSQSFPASGSFQNESALRIRQFTGGQIVSPGYILAKLPATINRSPWRLMGFSGGTSGKEPACQCRRCKRCGSASRSLPQGTMSSWNPILCGVYYGRWRPLCWKRLKVGEGDDRGWDGWMASLTQWVWVWASSGKWRTGKPVVL